MSSVEKALLMLRSLPRVAIHNIRDLPEQHLKRKAQHLLPRGKDAKYKIGADHKDAAQRMSRPRLGYGKSTPAYLKIPKEYYYREHHVTRQYIPFSLQQLQRMIDLGHLDPKQPIDLTHIVNTKLVMLKPQQKHFGIHLTDDGADLFKAQINIEVQWITSELTIAAIERNGGVVWSKYYDKDSLNAISDTLSFFKSGKPIPRNGTPPLNAIEFYTSPVNRGYLADPDLIREERFKLAQKYGYELKDLTKDPLKDVLNIKKDPRQIFYGLEPGWVVNFKDKVILKPTDPEYVKYYSS